MVGRSHGDDYHLCFLATLGRCFLATTNNTSTCLMVTNIFIATSTGNYFYIYGDSDNYHD